MATSPPVSISVTTTPPPENEPPVVRLVQPEDEARFRAPATITLVAEARDPDGTVATVEFFLGETSLGLGVPSPRCEEDEDDDAEEDEESDQRGGRNEEEDDEDEDEDDDEGDEDGENDDGRVRFTLLWTEVPAGEYVLTARATDNLGGMATSAPVGITVQPPQPPGVSIVVRDSEASIGESGSVNTARFEVRRNQAAGTDLTVFYSLSGTASNGLDYVELPGSVTIPAGQRTVPIIIVPLPREPGTTPRRQTVVLRLQPSPTSPPAYAVRSPSRGTASIRRPEPEDDDDDDDDDDDRLGASSRLTRGLGRLVWPAERWAR
jgi:hypothetical protein